MISRNCRQPECCKLYGGQPVEQNSDYRSNRRHPYDSGDSAGGIFLSHLATGLRIDNLPSFSTRFGPQVDWTSEKECFESFLRESAYFYTPLPPLLRDPSQSESHAEQLKGER
ncbi:uncharacterized protein LACBIDRAFT_310246 [Laccaria bicolor S238N-H82]|uniref:Predicted protein n=1 Tax=Laccaria bicolor (strain S238N-H82 / ATCC MYA-4686) TaxID=486041 RepID=B0DTS9_LACBS|nr:uncharacterized protein LACBIDRAFT_310246 [Laccaria bicolor S238N-H82]EDR01964.1 predicted protein [Laccaria bicolor S238N-H82]|eukprot:XP_001887355.1 predicted protein [Laccaria bicolor S238N-H82]